MRTKTVSLYTFDELSETAKDRARPNSMSTATGRTEPWPKD